MSQSQAMFLWVCYTCAPIQKVILVGCDWCMVFDPYFFAAEEPLPMMQTCTIVNFHNLHSLLGQFGSFILNKQNQLTSVGLW